MEKIEGTEMNGDNWYVKRHPVHEGKYIARHINIFGDESHTTDSLIEAMNVIKNKRQPLTISLILIVSQGHIELIHLVQNTTVTSFICKALRFSKFALS